jgi:hypothetical protein
MTLWLSTISMIIVECDIALLKSLPKILNSSLLLK